ncbi:DUF1254 domain-containing protein [Streptomyces sp. P01-B04]|uniref:DUF1254 domain-containing protein n=1 Tax=Streptomyces poriferorum TaxID=2798799 RepID=UPI001C5F2293|nr:DUF1254 domain-containing protein [Streptomyces poriferorum]MBW5254433.1 DUF1254 domain-containing protein [Streptomyces poriferorum]MBW5262291.1 DUF1254 domain-containing protein [Streptomyces poriferorum]
MSGVDLNAVRATAAEGWVYGHPMLENYRTMYAQAVNPDDNRYVGGFGTFRHYPQPSRPENTDIVTPNNDTPYSWCWLDLRAEPWVVSVPEMDRYYVLPFHDLDTTYVGFVGARTTGQGPGHYLIAGPEWNGAVPDGAAGVLRADTQLVGCLGRTTLTGLAEADIEELRAIQEQYRLRPLSAFTGADVPAPVPDPVWPVWREESGQDIEFFTVLDFLLGFFPVLPGSKDVRERLAALGVDGSGTFDPASLKPEVRAAMEEGISAGHERLEAAKAGATTSSGIFGTRAELGEDYLVRGIGADKGLYGLPPAEAWYGGWVVDSKGNCPPNAAGRDYTIHFTADQLPMPQFFWSATLYGLPERLLVDNPIDRYSIGDRTPGLVHDEDGGLTLYVQHTRPNGPQQAANWLPAPDGPFSVIIRMYGPEASVLDGTWQLPPLTVAG